MLNALIFGMRIENLISWFRRYTLLPVKCDLLSIIYLEINRWTNFYNKFYFLKVYFKYLFFTDIFISFSN